MSDNIKRKLGKLLKIILKPLRKGLSKAWYLVRYIIQGDGVSARFFWEHLTPTILILSALFLVVAMRFQCISKSNKVDRLEAQINVMRTEKQRQRSVYKTLTRESAMMRLVDSLNIGLSVPDKHPREVVLDPRD